MDKKRIIKKFEQLPPEVLQLVKQEYPDGFEDNLITFANPKGEIELALPLETDDTYYLIKMPKNIPSSEEDDMSDSSDFQNFENLDNIDIADEIVEDVDNDIDDDMGDDENDDED